MRKRKIKEINVEGFNNIINRLKKNRYNFIKGEEPKLPLLRNAYIIDKILYVELTYKDIDTSEVCTYRVNKAGGGSGLVHEITGMNAYTTIQTHYF